MKWVVAVLVMGGFVTPAYGDGFSAFLTKMGEKDLAASGTNALSLRFTIFPTWGNPVCVRVNQEEKEFRLVAKRLEGLAGYEVGERIVESKERVLSKQESKELLDSFSKLRFYEMKATKSDEYGADGERWYLEGLQAGRFHKVERWPADNAMKRRGLKEFVRFCGLLVRCADLDEPPKNMGRLIFERGK